MQVSVTTGGTPATVREDVKRRLEQQLGGRAVTPGAPELAEAVRTYVDRQLQDVAGDASVSVSASVFVSVSKPEPAPVAASPEAAEVPDPATEVAAAPPAAKKA